MLNHFESQQAIAPISPQTLYGEGTGLFLAPAACSVGPLFMHQMQAEVIDALLPTIQRLLILWPQISEGRLGWLAIARGSASFGTRGIPLRFAGMQTTRSFDKDEIFTCELRRCLPTWVELP